MHIGFCPPGCTGLWIVDSANPNCWESGRRQGLSRNTADVILMQETKLRKEKKNALPLLMRLTESAGGFCTDLRVQP